MLRVQCLDAWHTEAVHSLDIFAKFLNKSCESKVICFLTPSTALDSERFKHD